MRHVSKITAGVQVRSKGLFKVPLGADVIDSSLLHSYTADVVSKSKVVCLEIC